MKLRRSTLHCLLLTSLLVTALSAAPQPTEASNKGEEVSLSALNRVFDNLEAGLVPVEQGPITLLMSSPAHRLQVHTNRIELQPSETFEDGVKARFDVDLQGWAELIVQLQTAAGSTPFNDRVTVERQQVSAEADVRLVKTERGYDLTLLRAITPTVAFRIESSMTRQLVDACSVIGALLGGLSCDSLSESLTNIQVPLPEAGSQYEIDPSFLSAEEREVFDRWANAPAAPAVQ